VKKKKNNKRKSKITF